MEAKYPFFEITKNDLRSLSVYDLLQEIEQLCYKIRELQDEIEKLKEK